MAIVIFASIMFHEDMLIDVLALRANKWGSRETASDNSIVLRSIDS